MSLSDLIDGDHFLQVSWFCSFMWEGGVEFGAGGGRGKCQTIDCCYDSEGGDLGV